MQTEITALVVGRFQPFHKGHLHLLNETLKHADKIIIAIGSSNIKDDNNPLSFDIRKAMLEKVFENENLKNKLLKIVPSPDDVDDNKWLNLLLKNAGKFDIALGNNDWTNGILEKAGYKVISVPHVDRNELQGAVIRKLFRARKSWQKRVPKYLVEFIQKHLL